MRMTLVVSNASRHAWHGRGVLVVDSLQDLPEAAAANDVERVVIDRCASADQFLDLLAALPGDVAGDVMSVREDGRAYLSAIGRGGDRVLYALSPSDVAFYFHTNGLQTGPVLALTA